MDPREAVERFQAWFDGLPRHGSPGDTSGLPARGTVAGALVVIEKLKASFDLDLGHHLTPKGGQVSGVSGSAAGRILRRYGESRRLLTEGRTNRGLIDAVRGMLAVIESLELEELPVDARNAVLDELQGFLAARVTARLNQSGLPFRYDAAQSTLQSVEDLLSLARERGVEGQVAQHLVGAKLECRFPETEVENRSYSTADAQSGRAGDFQVKDTVFHVTVALSRGHLDKCVANLGEGHRVYLLVPERSLKEDKALANKVLTEERVSGRVFVQSIEAFVAQNVDEQSGFGHAAQRDALSRLLGVYNSRVAAAEPERSLLVRVPASLGGRSEEAGRARGGG